MQYKIQDDEAERVAELRNKYLELKKKKKNTTYLLYKLKYPFYWTLFFAIAGIAHQSIVFKKVVFADFFYNNYVEWFNSFGIFVSTYQIEGWRELGIQILSSWYYLFFTAGLISILATIISLIMHLIFNKKREPFSATGI